MNLNRVRVVKLQNEISLNGQKATVYDVTMRNGSMIRRADMISICDNLAEGFQKLYPDGYISVSIKYPNRWYSSNVSRLGRKINYFSMDEYDVLDVDPDEYAQFRFHFIPANKSQGGNDEHNDCLVNCIKKVVQTHADKIDAAELKKILGIGRDDPVPISSLPLVETYIQHKTTHMYGFHVVGEHQYVSPLATNKIIRLTLLAEHYAVDTTRTTKLVRRAFDEKPIVLYDTVNGEIVCYDGDRTFFMTREEFRDIKNKPLSSNCLLVPKNFNSKAKQLGVPEAYNLYMAMADQLKEKTRGQVNLYKASLKNEALHYFFNKVKTVTPEPIQNAEASWVEKASLGAVTYWERYEGDVEQFDVNSHYPNIISKSQHYFPVKEGKFEHLDELPTKLEFGIYRCVIDELPGVKLFRYNPENFYTNLDIDVARRRGMTVQLIRDEEANALIYTKDKLMNGAFLFGHYVKEIYALKEQRVPGSKDMLNVLWGALCEFNLNKFSADSHKKVELTDAEVMKFYSDDNQVKVHVVSYKYGYFKHDWARIKPFVLAYGRARMFWSYSQFEDDMVRVHTDGFYLRSKPTTILTGTKLGFLKYEGQKNVQITGLNKVKTI